MERSKLLILATVALAVLCGLLVVSPLDTRAQSASGVAITDGPGGVWIMRGDQLYVCRQPIVQAARASTAPPQQPQCSTPIRLP